MRLPLPVFLLACTGDEADGVASASAKATWFPLTIAYDAGPDAASQEEVITIGYPDAFAVQKAWVFVGEGEPPCDAAAGCWQQQDSVYRLEDPTTHTYIAKPELEGQTYWFFAAATGSPGTRGISDLGQITFQGDPPQPETGHPIVISQAELMELPTSGDGWERVTDVAADSWPAAGLSDDFDCKDSDVHALAGALVYARTGDTSYAEKTLAQLAALTKVSLGAGVHGELDTHHVGRNLLGHVTAFWLVVDAAAYWNDAAVAAAAEDLNQDALLDWIETLATRDMPGDSRTVAECHQERPNNWGTMCGNALVAMERHFAYSGVSSPVDLDSGDGNVVDVLKTFLGDPGGGWDGFDYGELDWQCEEIDGVATNMNYGINPDDCTHDGVDVSNLLPEEMRRTEEPADTPYPKENYVYTALQGLVMTAETLDRRGHDAWGWGDAAIARAFQTLNAPLWDGGAFVPDGDDVYLVPIVNCRLGTSYPVPDFSSLGRTFEFTDWLYDPEHSPLCR